MLKIILDTVFGYIYISRMILGSLLFPYFYASSKKDKSGLLMIAWYLPPSVSSGVYRPLSFIKYCAEKNIDFSCISGYLDENITDSGRFLESMLPAGLSLKRVKKNLLNPSWRFFPKIQQNGLIDAFSLYFEAIKLYDDNPPEVIVATGPPFSDFIAARFLSKRYSSKLLLDYRDEWSENPFDHIEKNKYDSWVENWCIKGADAVVFTTKSQIYHQLNVFPNLSKDKCHYIPNGWDRDFKINHYNDSKVISEVKKDFILISFVGHLGGHTNPKSFFDCLEMILDKNKNIRLKIRFVGGIGSVSLNEIEKFKYKDIVEITGHVSKLDAMQYMLESDLLLLLAEDGLNRYRPGKLYDYLSVEKPILAYGSEGEVKDVIDKLNAGFFVFDGGVLELEDILINRLSSFGNKSNKEAIDVWMSNHERTVLAEKFFSIVKTLQ